MYVKLGRLTLACLSLLLIVLQTGRAATDNQVAIASAHPLATYAGFEVIEKGGNVFDAAVAVSAALAVVEPAGSGLGGGGFWLLHRESDGYQTMLDGREKAPMAASRDMYLDQQGNVIRNLSIDGALSAGIPGMPAALVHLSEKFGRLSLAEALQPAIRYARDGFHIGHRHLRLLAFRQSVLASSPAASGIFLDNGRLPRYNTLLRQEDLAQTLELLAASGRAGFYQGAVAEKVVSAGRAAGGIWTLDDLKDYTVIERVPVKGQYHGVEIVSASPPSAGGIALIEALNILSGFDLSVMDPVVRKHVIAEAMRRAYHDRALYLGDPDFVQIPTRRLLSQDYAAGIRSTLRLDRALPSQLLSGHNRTKEAGRHTTHFSIIDAKGNRVAATLSINLPFGSGFVPPGTGVLLNDEMDDFVSHLEQGNKYGLTGGAANTIAPGKRMLSSMTPTFLKQGPRIAALGTPGGSRITTMLLLAVLEFAALKGPEAWVSVPRFHHQFLPDRIQYEKNGLTLQEVEKLTELGHTLAEVSYRYGNMQAVQLESMQDLSAASDPRGEGLALVR